MLSKEGCGVIEQLLDRCVDAWLSVCADETEEALLTLAVSSLSREGLWQAVTANTAGLLREHVARPSGLVMTPN